MRHIDDGQIFVGCEGEELTIAEAVRITGNKPSCSPLIIRTKSMRNTCKHELEELRENDQLSGETKMRSSFRNCTAISDRLANQAE